MAEVQINATRVKQGVFMGDHGQDVSNAVYVNPAQSVGDFVRENLTDKLYNGEVAIEEEWYLVIRLAKGPDTNE